MIVKSMSDLHVEHQYGHGPRFLRKLDLSGVDCLLLPGDISPICRTDEFEAFFKDVTSRVKNVLYVPGNHEYWRQIRRTERSAEQSLGLMKEVCSKFTNLHLFDNDIVTLDGKRFIGGTMWYDRQNDCYGKAKHVDDDMVSGLDPWVFQQNAKFIDLLDKELAAGDIVLSHHAPSHRSAEEKYQHSIMAHCWVHDVTARIIERKPSFWFHGHVHVTSGYQLGDTYVVCNPFGYEDMNNLNERFKLANRQHALS